MRCLEQGVGLLGQKESSPAIIHKTSLPEMGRVNLFLPLSVLKPAPFMSPPLNFPSVFSRSYLGMYLALIACGFLQ